MNIMNPFFNVIGMALCLLSFAQSGAVDAWGGFIAGLSCVGIAQLAKIAKTLEAKDGK